MDKELLNLLTQLSIATIALLALIVSLRLQGQARNKEIDNETAKEATEKLRVERESAVALAMATNQKALQDLVTKQISDTTNFSRQLMGLTAAHNAELHERTVAADKQAVALDNLGRILKAEIIDIGTNLQTAFAATVNHAADEMRASRVATDAQLSSIKAGVEYGNQAIDRAASVINTLPLDTTKVVLEIGDKAISDHARIQAAVDSISQQIANLPTYIVKSLSPVIDELRSANQQLQDTENKLIEVVKTVIPPPREVALVTAGEAQPLSEREVKGDA